MAENRNTISSLDDPPCQYYDDRSPSRLSRASSASSRFTREDVTVMNDNELDELCRQVFALCDTNGDGFITKDELITQCGEDDPVLLEQLMTTMDANNDGKISLDEFRLGLNIVGKHLGEITTQSTPKDKQVTLYEHVPLSDEDEEAWLITMERIDPNGYISSNKELRTLWCDLLTKDSHLLDKFEIFLSNIVEELDKSHSDVEHVERRMKQVLTNHSREVSEMDGILNEQIQEVYVQQQAKSRQTSDKLNDQYRDLLAERDQLIASLAEQEKSLQHKLYEKVQNEQELRNERLQLLNLNKSLQDQLSDSYQQLSASRKEIHRLSYYEKDETMNSLNVYEPLMETSLPLTDYHSESSISSQINNVIALSPPADQSFIDLSNNTFKSPSLAIEVAEALQQTTPTLQQTTPTLSYSSSVTPTGSQDDEETCLLIESVGVSHDNKSIGVSHDNESMGVSHHNKSMGVSHDNESIAGVSHDNESMVGVSHDNKSVGVSHDNESVGASHDNESVGVSHDNESVGVSHDNESVGVSHDNESVGVSHDNESVGVSHDNESVGVSHDNESVGVSHDNESVGVSHDNESVGVSHDNESVGVSHDNESVGVSHDNESVGVSHDNEYVLVSTKDINSSSNYQPSITPINLYYNHNSSNGSTIIQPRQTNSLSHSLITPSRVFKVVFLGDSGVGKTSLIHRLSCDKFTSHQSTLGLDFDTCTVPVGDERVVFQLWDTAGQERFQSTTAVYFRRADAFIVVYDVTNKCSFKNIKSWISLVKATLRTDLPLLMLMGNKTDKDEQRVVSKEEGSHLALELCGMFSETSALSGENVIQAHTTLASLLLRRENQDIEDIKRSALRLDKLQQKKNCKC